MNALAYISGMSLLAAALTTAVLSPAESSEPRSGTRLGDMGRDTVLYTKEQADIVFAAQSGSVPTNMSQLVDDVGYAKTNDIPVNVSQLANDAGYVTAERIADIVAEAVRAAVGPFAIVEDENGAVVLVRRADGVSGGGSVTNGQSGSTGGSTQE